MACKSKSKNGLQVKVKKKCFTSQSQSQSQSMFFQVKNKRMFISFQSWQRFLFVCFCLLCFVGSHLRILFIALAYNCPLTTASLSYEMPLKRVFLKLNVTHSDKRGTKSPGRSRDNWRKHHIEVVLFIFCFLFTLYGVLSKLYYCPHPHFDLHRDFRHISKAYLDKAV